MKEFSKVIEGRLWQGTRTKTVVVISEGADEAYFVFSWSEGVPF